LKRCSIATLPPFTKDPASRIPLQKQIYDFLRRAIASGDLLPGSKLPSTRSLARQWGVSRNTVLGAYEELAIEGLVSARIGSGTRVRGRLQIPTRLQIPRLPDPRVILRESHYPVKAMLLCDADGNPLYIHV
jgi:GntR family transcriptional regulator/MocR family aminotransferase